MKVLLVDDEEQILKGVKRLISCEEDDWDVATAISGELALERLKENDIDVVVSDMRMPGMDGAELLSKVVERHPSVLRIVLSGQADSETVLRAVKPMHQYLSKPCEPGKLFEAIRRAEILQETIAESSVLDAIGRANCLPGLPEVVTEINNAIASESNAKAIAEIVSRDPVLSARLLQLANSAIFGLKYPIADIDRATSVVGTDLIRSLAMSQAVAEKDRPNDSVISAKKVMDHGFHVAEIASRLARRLGVSADESSTVFAAALLHDVGKLILLDAFPEKYRKVVEISRRENRCIEDVEMEVFNATHQGIGGYLFVLWGLPVAVTTAVASHHSFRICAIGGEDTSRLVFAANWIASNKSADELPKLVEDAGGTPAAIKFATQITDWQNFITSAELES